VTFGCSGDVQLAECLNGLSTEWLTAARPEEKVKGYSAGPFLLLPCCSKCNNEGQCAVAVVILFYGILLRIPTGG